MQNRRYLLPVAFALVLVFGILIGLKIAPVTSNKPLGMKSGETTRIERILNYISQQYVDSINVDSIVGGMVNTYLNDPATIDALFKNLDPHSSYIHKEDLQGFNEQLEGNFDGIGIEFNIVDDTIMVVAALSGGPSEKLGIKAGDKIIKIDDSLVAGNGITSDKVVSKLRGIKGTKVMVDVKRNGVKDLMNFVITRNIIPITSIDAAYMVDDKIGYIRVNKFSAETPLEFDDALQGLINKGMKSLMLDLRGNPGGYLRGAVSLADEFLSGTPLIVYTDGRAVGKEEYHAERNGLFEQGNLVVLINEYSASASEILAGALQDNKRAVIVGRKSFGKGLVQEVFPLPDSSAVRLTIARYYTPSGKCIQRPYDKGVDAYYDDYYSILMNGGEIPDSLKSRINGDWGIHPDVEVKLDTSEMNQTLNYVFNRNIIQDFAYTMYASNTSAFDAYPDFYTFYAGYTLPDATFEKFVAYVLARDKDKGVTEAELRASKSYIETGIKAIIARQKWGDNGYYYTINQLDNIFRSAKETLAGMKKM